MLVAVVALLLGRAYGYFHWEVPLRVVVWDQKLFGPVVAFFGSTWEAYAADLRMDRVLKIVSWGLALLLVGSAAAAVFHARCPRRLTAILLYLAAGVIALHAALETKDHFYHVAQFGEHALQMAAPVLLVLYCRRSRLTLPLIRIATATTFAAHGLYAIGLYPVPTHFVDMTMVLLNGEESFARGFLSVVGWLDLLVAVGVFVPRLDRYAFAYAFLWGTLTAFARIIYGLFIDAPGVALHGYAYQTIFRFCHGLLPLAGYLLTRRRSLVTGLPRAERLLR